MDKKDYGKYAAKDIVALVSEKAYDALEAGKGSRAIGGGNGIEVGNTYTLLKIDYREQLMPPSDMTTEEFNELSEEEKKEVGRMVGWFEFVTNNGGLSFSAVLGDKDMHTAEFWEDTPTKIDNFDVTNIFCPTARTPEAWIKTGCDGLLGKTLQCVATREYQRGRFDAKARAFVIVG